MVPQIGVPNFTNIQWKIRIKMLAIIIIITLIKKENQKNKSNFSFDIYKIHFRRVTIQMGVGSSQSLPSSTFPSALAATFFPHQSQPIFSFNPSTLIFQRPCKRDMTERSLLWSSSSSFVPLNSGKVDQVETQVGSAVRPMYDFHGIDEELLQRMVYDALVWSSLHGLVVGDRTVKVSGQRLRFGAISIFIFR